MKKNVFLSYKRRNIFNLVLFYFSGAGLRLRLRELRGLSSPQNGAIQNLLLSPDFFLNIIRDMFNQLIHAGAFCGAHLDHFHSRIDL